MPVPRKGISFAQQIAIDRHYDQYIYGGNWDPFQRLTGTDCSGCVVDELDASLNNTAMEWTRHGLSTENWRPPSMGGAADPNNGPFGTVMVDDPSEFPADAAVLIALHHGPGGGANSHMWCQVDQLKIETHGSDNVYPNGATVLYDGQYFNDVVRDVHDTSYANSWWYLPGPIVDDGTPVPHQPSGVGIAPPGEPADTLFADISYFQAPLDPSYFAATYEDAGTGPWNYRVISIRANDGGFVDPNFAGNYQQAVNAVNAGQADFFIVYYYWRPGSQAVQTMMSLVNAQGGPHPKMVAMIDLESGGNPDVDVSSQVNSDYYALQQWLGNDARVIAYANVGDEKQMWQAKPEHLPMILAGYGSNPNDPTVFKIAHQYTDGTVGAGGLPTGAPPFGNCDMNSADGFSPSQLAAALGVGDGSVPTPVPQPPPPPVAPPPSSGGQTYTVAPGDTMFAIAAQFGISLAALEGDNPQIGNFAQINVGQVINIPGAPASTVARRRPSARKPAAKKAAPRKTAARKKTTARSK
jgi:LysM repeat protein